MSDGLTKKQLKELRKLEKMQAKAIEKKNENFKWIAVSVVTALFLVFFVGVILVAKNKNNPETANTNATIAEARHSRMVKTNDSDATASAAKAEESVTLVEYADIQCPACRTYNPIIKQIYEAYPDRVNVVFKHFPLITIHPNAMPAAIAAEAAGKQNKFFEFVDLAYDKQGEWSGLANPQQKFEEYARSLKLNVEQFKEDQKDPELEKAINAEREEAIANGVNSTPTFFLEGKRISVTATLDDFKKVIDEALKNKTNSAPQETTVSPTESSAPKSLQLQE